MVELLRRGLSEEGHTVVCASDGREGLEYARHYEFDAIILDIMLPRLSGYEVAQHLRREKIATPVLMLTAKDSVPDLVRGLDAGADDYLAKPFAFEELLARVRALVRRREQAESTTVSFRDLQVDLATGRAERSGHPLILTAKEHSLLVFLLRHTGQVLSRTRIYE